MRTIISGWPMATAAITFLVVQIQAATSWGQTIRPEKPQANELRIPLPLAPENELFLDHEIYDALRTVINTGADLYNQESDRAGCYRLYQGSLLTLRPLLLHHSDLQKAIDNALADAGSKPSVAARAFALRAVLDEIRSKLKPAAPVSSQEPPLAVPPKSGPAPANTKDKAEPKKSGT